MLLLSLLKSFGKKNEALKNKWWNIGGLRGCGGRFVQDTLRVDDYFMNFEFLKLKLLQSGISGPWDKQTIKTCNIGIISAAGTKTHSSGLVAPFHSFIIRHKSHFYLVYHFHVHLFFKIRQICFILITWKPAPLSDRSLLNYLSGNHPNHLFVKTNKHVIQ